MHGHPVIKISLNRLCELTNTERASVTKRE